MHAKTWMAGLVLLAGACRAGGVEDGNGAAGVGKGLGAGGSEDGATLAGAPAGDAPAAGAPAGDAPAAGAPAQNREVRPESPPSDAGRGTGAKPSPPRVHDFSAVDAAARAYVEELGLPGGALLVLQDGRVAHEAFYGQYTASTVVALASATKWLSGAVVMALVDRGALALDDPVSKYVPEFTGAKSAITVRMLFDHTSGLPSEHDARGGFLGTLEQSARDIAAVELLAPPGSTFRYGGVSMQAGGRVAEVAGGKPWRELFHELVAGPLQLGQTNYGRRGASQNPQIAGGASSSLRDYGRFLQMLLDGGRFDGRHVLSAEAVRELVTDRTGDAAMASPALQRRLASQGYGVGCWVERKDERGATLAAGSPGAFGFVPWIDFEHRVAVVWMIADRAGARRRAGSRFEVLAAVYAALGLPPPVVVDRPEVR